MNTDDADNSFNPCFSVFIRVLFFCGLVMMLFVACSRQPQLKTTIVATPSSTPQPNPTRPAHTPVPTSTPAPSATPAGWETVRDGVQIRRMTGVDVGRSGDVFVLRLDPARIDVRLRYDPERPRSVAAWFEDERPLAALNAAFFDRDYTPVGLWVVDGATFGRGHYLMQGEFRVSGAGLAIRRVSERYLSDGTRIIASLESYPYLLYPGGIVNPCLLDSGDRRSRLIRPCANLTEAAERLVVGFDRAGFLMFVLAPFKTFTFTGLAGWLSNSDLNLDVALNLDGGSSAGMLVQVDGSRWGSDSAREVPGAILIMPKILGLDEGDPP